jgi:hypothetical protein
LPTPIQATTSSNPLHFGGKNYKMALIISRNMKTLSNPFQKTMNFLRLLSTISTIMTDGSFQVILIPIYSNIYYAFIKVLFNQFA